MPREILLTGSVPLAPAAAVFETVARHLGTLAPRIPDGEQIGWLSAAARTFETNPALEVARRVPLTAGGAQPVDFFKLKDGLTAKDLQLGPYGYAENAIRSYGEFRRLRAEGKIPAATRYQATLPGPGTSSFRIGLPAEELLPLAREAQGREIEGMLRTIPPQDLTIQLDLGMEAEHEEYLRAPDHWDQPVHKYFHWTLDQMAESAAWLANRVPPEAEVGFHICSIWHHDPKGGQDNRVLVDAANAVAKRATRPVAYFHIPVIPDHGPADFAAFRDLALGPDTKIYLGLLNGGDGIEGARRRIELGKSVLPDFGIGWYCGLGRPPTSLGDRPTTHENPMIPALRKANEKTIGAVLELHRQAAEL